MKANSDKSKQSKKATRRVLAGVLCGASVLSLVLSLVMPPISQAIANDAQTEETVTGDSSTESTDVENTNNGDAKNQNSGEIEGGASEDAAAAGLPSDDTKVEGDTQPSDAQPADDENNDENALATVSADDYTKVSDDVAEAFTNGGKFQLTGSAYSDQQIEIAKNTTINLAGNMLYNRSGGLDSFFVVKDGATLTIEDAIGDSDSATDEKTPVNNTSAGQLATMAWKKRDGSNLGTPTSLTYYETRSTPNPDGLGTTETAYEHVVTGFGAIDAASESGSVKYVVNVKAGGILNLKGGMITTAANLSNDGHVIYSEGTVKIAGGYVTNGNGGGWGGGLCMAKGSLNMTGGVIAANKAASGGGIFADSGVTLDLSGGVISGNATYAKGISGSSCGGDTGDGGYGGGVYTKGANVTIGGSANITNNQVDAWIADSNLYNFGLLGGGGIACTHRGTLTMTGGSVTANYSKEAGGGIYAGFWNQAITFKMTGGTIAGNESVNAEGGGLRISTGTTGDIGTEPGASNKVYITNNKTMTGESRGGDWGGGGVFVQKDGKLNIVRTLITDNEAGGWGGGIGACPTGETIVSHSNGAAIYNNTDNGLSNHMSAGGNGKNEDSDPNYITKDFKEAGHKDFFLVRKNDSNKTVAVVLGKMLGGGSAGWKGTCDRQKITIDPNGGAEAKYMFGLEAHPSDAAKSDAQRDATTIISGNYSYTHGGGIMTNGDLIVGEVTSLDVYPAIKVKANKVLMKDGKPQGLTGHGYKFKLLGKAADSAGEPYWNTDGSLNANGCEATSEVTVNESGEIVIDTAANYQSGNYDLYLVEVPIEEKGTTFDKAIYKIHVEVSDQPVKTTNLLGIEIKRFSVNASTSMVSVKKKNEAEFTKCDASWSTDTADSTVSTVKIGDESNPAFTNELAPYQASGTWTPQVTKKVDGGEMKKFKFELYTKDADDKKQVLDTQYTSKGTGNEATVLFDNQTIGPLGLKNLDKNRQAQFTYYIRECPARKDDGTKHEGYTNDTKTFKVVVTATDKGDGTLDCTPAYYEVDASGKPSESPTTDPTFTNTYSTSLPLSGMSGVTLTYLAGAAVLCAAAAWMHIRRKANAKGGERRE